MIEILLENARGDILARAAHASDARLFVQRAYEPGDRYRISGGRHMIVQMAAALAPAEIYAPSGHMTYAVPLGDEQRAYAPGAFAGDRHVVAARAMTAEEIARPRNLALNPADLRGETDFYPHATANVETRGESVFAARNVIDGMILNRSHGDWPFESWGIGAREDAYLTVDFGRDVLIDSMNLVLRADFPHDAYWLSGHVVLGDGADIPFSLKKTDARQFVPLGAHTVRRVRLERLQKSDDPSAFPALIEWEILGRDIDA